MFWRGMINLKSPTKETILQRLQLPNEPFAHGKPAQPSGDPGPEGSSPWGRSTAERLERTARPHTVAYHAGPDVPGRALLVQRTGDIHGRARATLQLPVPRARQAFCMRTYAPPWGPDGGPRRGGPAAGGSGGLPCSQRRACFAGAKGDLLGAHIGVLSTQDIWLHEEFQSAHDVSGLLGGHGRGPRQPGEAADSEQAKCKVFSRLRQQTPARGRTQAGPPAPRVPRPPPRLQPHRAGTGWGLASPRPPCEQLCVLPPRYARASGHGAALYLPV